MAASYAESRLTMGFSPAGPLPPAARLVGGSEGAVCVIVGCRRSAPRPRPPTMKVRSVGPEQVSCHDAQPGLVLRSQGETPPGSPGGSRVWCGEEAGKGLVGGIVAALPSPCPCPLNVPVPAGLARAVRAAAAAGRARARPPRACPRCAPPGRTPGPGRARAPMCTRVPRGSPGVRPPACSTAAPPRGVCRARRGQGRAQKLRGTPMQAGLCSMLLTVPQAMRQHHCATCAATVRGKARWRAACRDRTWALSLCSDRGRGGQGGRRREEAGGAARGGLGGGSGTDLSTICRSEGAQGLGDESRFSAHQGSSSSSSSSPRPRGAHPGVTATMQLRMRTAEAASRATTCSIARISAPSAGWPAPWGHACTTHHGGHRVHQGLLQPLTLDVLRCTPGNLHHPRHGQSRTAERCSALPGVGIG